MWSLAASQPFAEELASIWWSWHSAPAGCQNKVVKAVAFCLGSGAEDRRLVAWLEVSLAVALVALAFFAGRLTAEQPLICG